MTEALFRAAAMPQFSAEPSGVRPQRRESGNMGADQTQWATRNGARAADELVQNDPVRRAPPQPEQVLGFR
jgi:hypothetical protein